MNFPYEAMKQQRLAWGAAVVMGAFLIYEGAPIIPVVAGCILALVINAMRSRVGSKNSRRHGT